MCHMSHLEPHLCQTQSELALCQKWAKYDFSLRDWEIRKGGGVMSD